MAATLAEIKSRMLLPRPVSDEEDEGEDPRRYRSTLLRLAAARWRIDVGPTGGLGFVRPRSGVLLRLALLESFRAERAGVRRFVTASVLAAMVVFGWPAAQQAEQKVEQLAGVIRRPPGSLQLRYLVLQRLAQEEQSETDQMRD